MLFARLRSLRLIMHAAAREPRRKAHTKDAQLPS